MVPTAEIVSMPECPECGSRVTKAVPEEVGEGFVIVRDRICQDCDHRFTPPLPKWAPYGLIVAGSVMLLTAVVIGGWFVGGREAHWGNLRGVLTAGSILLVGGGTLLGLGIRALGGDEPDNKIF